MFKSTAIRYKNEKAVLCMLRGKKYGSRESRVESCRVRPHAWERSSHTTKKAHACTTPPSIILPSPLYRLPGQQERDIPGGMLRRRGGGEREQEQEENEEEERQGTKRTRSTNCDRRVLTAAPGLVCHRKPYTPCLQARRDRRLRSVHPWTFNTDLMQLSLWPPGPKKPASDSRPRRGECCMFVGKEMTTNISQHVATKRWTRRRMGMSLNTNATSDSPLE